MQVPDRRTQLVRNSASPVLVYYPILTFSSPPQLSLITSLLALFIILDTRIYNWPHSRNRSASLKALAAVSPRLVASTRRNPYSSRPLPLFFPSRPSYIQTFPLSFFSFSLSPSTDPPPSPSALRLGRRVRLIPFIVCQASTKALCYCPLYNPLPLQRREVLGPS